MRAQYPSGEQHPRFVKWEELEKKLDHLQLNGLVIVKSTFKREGKRRLIDATCNYCKKQKPYYVDSLLRGTTKGCICQRNRKYGNDPRADMLGERYDCIVQRCSRDTHKQAKDYKGRGIKCEFTSREHFVRWALATWPNTDFKGLEFDRKDNNGNYSPENLRLATPTENHLNRDDAVYIFYKGKKMHWSHWPSPYSPGRTQFLASSGMTGEQIITEARRAVVDKRKCWPTILLRLKQFGYVQEPATQCLPVIDAMGLQRAKACLDDGPALATEEQFQSCNNCTNL
jgi:hypothetical protein